MVNYSSNVLIMVIIFLAAIIPAISFGFFSIDALRQTIENEELNENEEPKPEPKKPEKTISYHQFKKMSYKQLKKMDK